MRKLILSALAAAVIIPAAAQAQSYGEVRRDRAELRHDRRDAYQARRHGDGRDLRDARRDLRDDRRETRGDWQDYRRSHPEAFRGGGGYAGPRGWAYRPVDTGHRFAPEYYHQRYWVDPIRYHLAVAPGYARWVRYGNDVVLVNVRTGRVLAVHRAFFY